MNGKPFPKCYLCLTALLILCLLLPACGPASSTGGEEGGGAASSPEGSSGPAPSDSSDSSASATLEDSSGVVNDLPAPPQSRPATLDELPEDMGGMLKLMFNLQDTDRVFLSEATPLEVHRFYRDELDKRGYTNPFYDLQIEELNSPDILYIKDGAQPIHVIVSLEEETGQVVVVLKAFQENQ